MNFKAFDTSKIDEYAAEAKQKWGSTDAYQEYKRKTEGRNIDFNDLMQFFADMGKIKHLPPDSNDAQKAIKDLQQFITERYYTCTPQILAGLGQMYICDARFRQNIDTFGGNGTAEFVSKAIDAYCIDLKG